MTVYRPLTEVTRLPLTQHGFDVAYFPNDLSDASIQSTGDQYFVSLGPYVLCESVEAGPSAAERTASALERIATALEATGLVDTPIQTSALTRIAAVLESLVSAGGNLKVENP